MIQIASVEEMLALHEGEKFRPYVDTVGKVSIGIGRNLSDVGISKTESRYMFANDLARAEAQVDRQWPWASELDLVRRACLVDMTFNMGGRLRKFKRFLESLEAGAYMDAAVHMLDSRWADQVGGRALRLAEMVRTGRWPTE
ncbi:MAG: hypothetical protein QGI10_00095 [Vicinamibacterales bacterium]|jgi:lysozyme|nr:hypothetical protein [Vicinamibacterales bacterium]MDP7477647.1 hypothetical protein [Vicinamibacterales bacterium]